MNTRFAVAVPVITPDINLNLDKILSMMKDASSNGVDLLLFPEAVITGLALTDNFEIDKKLAFPLESPLIQTIVNAIAGHNMWTAFGFLELVGTTIFDSALLVNRSGTIILHQRRLSPGWRAKDANPIEYGSGNALSIAVTPWGKTAILICGDLFETAFFHTVNTQLSLLLFPFARCFKPEVKEPQKQWDCVEFPDYSARVKQIGALTLMSNYIATTDLNGGAFGGGFVVDENGKALATRPLFEEGLLIFDQSKGKKSQLGGLLPDMG